MTEEAQEEAQGGRIFFSSTGRTFGEEDELCVLSVGVDIGSSTSHLVFSRIVLERLDSRYVVTERESFYQSDILLTPYSAEETIDADALGDDVAAVKPFQHDAREHEVRGRRADIDADRKHAQLVLFAEGAPGRGKENAPALRLFLGFVSHANTSLKTASSFFRQ